MCKTEVKCVLNAVKFLLRICWNLCLGNGVSRLETFMENNFSQVVSAFRSLS